jgi:hypothetical protein
MLRIILEIVLEAIYFSIFIIKGKELKEKRLLFIALMIFQYLALTTAIKYNIWMQISYTILVYMNLKILYKKKAQITDVFLFGAASIILIIISILCAQLKKATNMPYFYALIINRLILFVTLFLLRNKISVIYQRFYKRWNRHKDAKKIKSLTLRNISIIVFNLMFYIINISLTYIILTK